MAGNQQFCLRWNNHQSTLISVFDNLLESGTLVDCTLAAEGQYLKAHKVVLSACSPFFEGLFSQHYEKHPIIILKDVTFGELKAMLDYMYRGEVNISQEQLGAFLKAAESLQIKGLTDNSGNGDLQRRSEPRKVIIPPVSKSPCFPQGLIVEPRPPTKLTNNNNNVDSPPVQQRLDASPKRRKRRLSEERDEDGEIPLTATIPPPICTVKEDSLPSTPTVGSRMSTPSCPPHDGYIKVEAKAELLTNNDDSGDEMAGYPDEDEEEEMDLTKPGTSHGVNNHPPGVWNASGDNTSEDYTPGGMQDQEQRTLVVWPLLQSLKGSGGGEGNTTPSGSGGGRGSASRNISCPTCHKCYSSQHTLRRHIRLECGKEPQFHCPYCPRKTKQRYNLMLHIARAHKPEHIQPPW